MTHPARTDKTRTTSISPYRSPIRPPEPILLPAIVICNGYNYAPQLSYFFARMAGPV